MKRLNLGCGRSPRPDWLNLDHQPLPGVDIVADLDACQHTPLPLDTDSIDEMLASHVLEHLHHPLPCMAELHRIAKPDARLTVRLPYGSSDAAFADPTHVRPYFIQSFGFFSQPFYFKADYGYRGDWLTEKIILRVDAACHQGKTSDQLMFDIQTYRNIVLEMEVNLRAIKPIREPRQDLIVAPPIEIQLVDQVM